MMEEMMNLVCNLKTITQHFIFYRIYCIRDVCMPEALQEQLSVAKRHWHQVEFRSLVVFISRH